MKSSFIEPLNQNRKTSTRNKLKAHQFALNSIKKISKIDYCHQKIFNEFQNLIKIENKLTTNGSCQCNICRVEINLKQTEQRICFFNSQSYLNLFRLLQHLTMLENKNLGSVLGELRIPLLFFKKLKKNKLKRNQSSKNNLINRLPYSQNNFLMFKSDEESGILQFPQLISTYHKVITNIRNSLENILKIQNKKYKQQIINGDERFELNQTRNGTFIHSKYFQKSIPSMFLSSTQAKPLRDNMRKASNYIIHNNDAYISQQIQNHKIHKLEPFCIFRYKDTGGSTGRNKKYEIFSLQTIQRFAHKNQMKYKSLTEDQRQLDLLYIESFTKIKQIQISKKGSVDDELDEKQKSAGKNDPRVFYSEYLNNSQIRKSQCFEITSLQIKIKSNRIGKLDDNYMDLYALEAYVSKYLSSFDSDAERNQALATYKTYKLINYLEIVLKITVKQLNLKWILNQFSQIILTQCIEYKIDEDASLFGEFNTYKQKILINGLDLLFESQQKIKTSEEIVELLKIHEQSMKIQTIKKNMKIKLRQIQQKNKNKTVQQKVEVQMQKPKIKKSLKQMSKSVSIKKNLRNIKISYKKLSNSDRKMKMDLIHERLSSLSPDSEKTNITNEKLSKFDKMKNYCQIHKKVKKFRLKPYRTQQSVTNPQNSNSSFHFQKY